MKLFHNSQDLRYRTPFGAVPAGTTVVLRMQVISEKEPQKVWLRVFGKDGQAQFPMEIVEDGGHKRLYETELFTGNTPQLLWYDFIVEGKEETLYYFNNADGLGGVGQMASSPAANSYQITVYDPGYHTPAWFRDRIMYQIFPDRFFGAHGPEGIPRKREDYVIHEDWHEPLSFQRHPYEDGPACNDFYGGNLQGIMQKLPYLKRLGVGVLYLNPIFDAYSNHKYDTADYKTIDPMFGTEEDFALLCKEAEKYGIGIILDGVFSHTGADSIYFNKYGSYGEHTGAWRDPNSPYRPWYQFTDYPNYNSWWGCSNLPNVNEMEPSYLDYILRDKDAVIKHWIHRGASGWRLDVADELPDEFIKMCRKELKKENPEAVLIGEVWEDASHKTAYGKEREYLLGEELDSVMNYPFKEQVLGFLMGWWDAVAMSRRIMSQLENYPIETAYSLMNILGTHDTMRVKSLLGGMNEDCGASRLCSGMEELASQRLMLGVFMQMTFYGVPCIYYGDEVGMQGGKDPFNRGTFPWRAVDPQLLSWYRKMGALRNRLSCLRRGYFEPVYARNDVYAYLRRFRGGRNVFGDKDGGSLALCAVNRGFEEQTAVFALPEVEGMVMRECCGGAKEILEGRQEEIKLTLPPLTAKMYVWKQKKEK